MAKSAFATVSIGFYGKMADLEKSINFPGCFTITRRVARPQVTWPAPPSFPPRIWCGMVTRAQAARAFRGQNRAIYRFSDLKRQQGVTARFVFAVRAYKQKQHWEGITRWFSV